MIVVKLGGSLYSSSMLIKWIDRLVSISDQTIVIVPGGGPFADQVRQAYHDWPINDCMAHDMAVLAMQQFALLIHGLNKKIIGLETIHHLDDNHTTYVWLPYKDVVGECDYPKNWSITSDSLALWCAKKLSAEKLFLIKSADISKMEFAQIISSDIVDDYFIKAYDDYSGEILFHHVSQWQNFEVA